MKKLFLTVAVVLMTFAANAQDGFKGKWFVMGQAGYGTQADGNIKNYSFLPAVGTFVAPTTAVGMAIGYIGSEDKTSEDTTFKSNGFTVMPLARQYWGVTDNFLLFGQLSVPLMFGKDTVESKIAELESKYTAYGVELGFGIDYFLSSNWSIEAGFGLIGWHAVKPKEGDATNDFNIGLNSGLLEGVKFGIKYVF